MSMRLGILLGITLALGACSDGDNTGAGGDNQAAAQALTKAISFAGGTLQGGTMPDGTSALTLAPAPGGTVTPGQAALMSFSINTGGEPMDVTLVQFAGSQQHFEVEGPTAPDGGVPSEDQSIELSYTVDPNVCDDLCNKIFSITVVQAVRMDNGDVSKHVTTTLKLDCREDGKASLCSTNGAARPGQGDADTDDQTTGTPGTGGGGVALDGDKGSKFIEVYAELQSVVCACDGTDPDCADSPEELVCPARTLDSRAGELGDQLDCMIQAAMTQLECAQAASCDFGALSACGISESSDGGHPFQAQCGALPAAVETEIDACDATHMCADGTPVPGDVQCDGFDDCPDGSDEMGCSSSEQLFECATGGITLSREQLCDGTQDCPDGGDEQSICTPCETGEDTYYIGGMCDGIAECEDGSDELGCGA